jgi:hypothetical protein
MLTKPTNALVEQKIENLKEVDILIGQSIVDLKVKVDLNTENISLKEDSTKLFKYGLNFLAIEPFYYRPLYNVKINSIDNIDSIPFALLVNGDPYTFGDPISKYVHLITVSVEEIGLLVLNFELI